MDISELKASFIQLYGDKEAFSAFFAPGRINLIGEHLDYNGGHVLPVALSLGIAALVRLRKDGLIRLNSLNMPGEIIIDLKEDIFYQTEDYWGNYPKGVIKYLQQDGFVMPGYDILYAANLPSGAGLSSSAALEVLTAFMIMTMEGERDTDRIAMARLCQRVENEFIGVNSGIMDQFAVALGIHNDALLIDCDTLSYRHVTCRWPEHSLLIMNTNKRRELASSHYNQRRRECEEALALLNMKHCYKNLCAADLQAVEALRDPLLRKRARHVVTENLRVFAAVRALEQGQLDSFGQLLIASHQSLKNDYEVTGFELDTIVEEACMHAGCKGARMTGAGFGGSAIALVENKYIEDFIGRVGKHYREKTGLEADFYISHSGDGVHQIF